MQTQTKMIDVSNAQGQLAELIALVQQGVEVILADGATPLAHIVPLLTSDVKREAMPRIAGLHEHVGAIWTSDDFDDPLPDEFWLGEEGGADEHD